MVFAEYAHLNEALKLSVLQGTSLAGDCLLNYFDTCVNIDLVSVASRLDLLETTVFGGVVDLLVVMGDADLGGVVAHMVRGGADWTRDIPVVVAGDRSTSFAVRQQLASRLSGFVEISWTAERLLDSLAVAACRKPIGMHPRGSTLSDVERETVVQLAGGMTAKESSTLLGVSSRTIDARRRRVQNKIGVDSLAALTKYCIREGLVKASEESGGTSGESFSYPAKT